MTKNGFGERLKRERELRGVTLDEICVATRISTRFLEALENEEWDRLPGGVFNRGFVRAVARFLGLDEEGFVAEYAVAASNQVAPAETWTPLTAKPQTSRRPLAWLAVVATILILGSAGWFGWRWHARRAVLRTAAPQSAAANAQVPQSSAPASGPVADDPSNAKSPARANPPANANATNPGGNASDTNTPPAAGDGGLNPAPADADSLLLKIEAGKATSVRVSADGKSVFDGRVAAGENHTFKAAENFQITAADGGALLLELNGRTLAPIGPPGRPGRVKLTHRDASTPAGGFD